MKKKLQLHRMTIANLSVLVLRRVGGGAGSGTDGAGVQSVLVDTKIEPCEWGTQVCYLDKTPP